MSEGGSRRLATVLFTDMVGSTEIAARLGDARWRELLKRHHVILRRELKRFGGREIDTAGDGIFAVFDVPAQAVRCACAIADGTQELGVDIRAGLHVGEVETTGREVRGIAVHTGSRLCALGGSTDVLVTSTLTELVGGAGIEFEDRGVHTFKGVPGEWRVFNVTKVAGASRPAPLDPATIEERLGLIEPPPFVRRNRRWIVVAVFLTVLAVAALVALTRNRISSPTTAGPPLNSLVEIDPANGRILATVRGLPFDPRLNFPPRIAIGEGGVWWLDGIHLVHVDELTNEPRPTITLVTAGLNARSLAVGFRTVWVGGKEGLLRVDPATDQVLTSISVPGLHNNALLFTTNSVVVGKGAIWATGDGVSREVVRVNPHTGEVETLRVRGGTDGATVGSGAVWILDNARGTLSRIDQSTGKVTGQAHLSGTVNEAIAGKGTVWVLDSHAGTLTPINTTDLLPRSPLRVGSSPSDFALGLGEVWVADYDGTIYRIDPETGEVRPLIHIGSPIAAIAVDQTKGTLWVAIAGKQTGGFL